MKESVHVDYLSPVAEVIEVAAENLICLSGASDYVDGGSFDFDTEN